MTIEELLGKVPEEWHPVVRQYGPSLLAMTADELWAWIELLIRGDTDAAYRQLLDGMDNAELAAEMATITADWAAANARNAARLDLQRSALAAILKVLLATALASVGL